MLWMLLFLIVPLALIVYFSFWTQEGSALTPDLTLDSYQRFFRSDVYVGVMLNTVRTWLIVLGLTLLIGYPVAYFISMMVDNPRNQTILLLLAIIPFWTSFLIRVLAWRPMLGENGAINIVLQRLGIIDQPLSFLLYTEFGAILGMTQIYAVFMVGPITFSLGRLDRSVVDAARDLGASPLKVFKDIIWPLSLPGVVAGSIFVSVMVLGEFATNSALSGRKFNLLGNIILTQVGNLKWAFAAVVGVILTILIGIVIGLLLRVVDLRKQL
ncbi:MAG: transporter permease [Thermomicrobiales bacterium]|jgi:putative spermidine/putrescine transport system permease protein|nr:transporter permease [Thermomicrobiales bacterium]